MKRDGEKDSAFLIQHRKALYLMEGEGPPYMAEYWIKRCMEAEKLLYECDEEIAYLDTYRNELVEKIDKFLGIGDNNAKISN